MKKPVSSHAGRTLIAAMVALAGSVPRPVFAVQAPGRDEVVVRIGGREESRQVLHGDVVEFTGEMLVIRLANGTEIRRPADEVVRIRTPRNAAHADADGAFEARDYGAALSAYRRALADEPRAWVQRMILARMTWCARNLHDVRLAGETFLELYRSDRHTRDFSAIPLAWTSEEVPAALEAQARIWMEHTDDAAVLIGASLLLATEHRDRALEALRGLSSADDERVRLLAEMQTWRARLADASTREVAQWHDAVRRMPVDLRGGPHLLLGDAYARLREPEQAALQYLWTALAYPEDESLAARACLEAGGQLEAAGRFREAEAMYAELLTRFPQSAYRFEAEQLLGEMSEGR